MARSSNDLESLQMCANCYSETPNMCQRACKHVICKRCDFEYRQTFPGHGCIKCHDNAPDSDDESYLTPITLPRPLTILGREDLVSDNCESHKTEKVTTRCHDCNLDICDRCVEQHSIMTFLKSHRLSPKLDVPQSPVGTPKISCRHHPHETANLSCLPCDRKRLCRICVRESHGNHEVENDKIFTFMSPAMNPTVSTTNTLDDLLRELKDLANEMKAKKARMVSEIDKANKDIQQHALTRVEEMLEEADKMKNDIDEQVREQTRTIQRKQNALLSQLIKRKNFIKQRTEKMNLEINSTQSEIESYLQLMNRQSTSTGGYTRMVPEATIAKQREHFQQSLDELRKRLQELIFQYTPPTEPSEGLGKIEPLRRLHIVSSTRVERFEREDEYVVTGIMAAPGDNIIFTSCKGERKAAIDLVNIHGNAIGTRKLHDPGDESVTMTPAFGTMIDNDTAIMAWEKSVFVLEVGNRENIEPFGVRETMVPDAKISCLAISHELARVALGNDKNRIINLFNFKVEKVSSITIKESGNPPKSLAFWKKSFLVTDGVESAFLADPRGNTIVHFPSPKVESKPLAIDACKGIAYVLWGNEESSSFVQFYSLFQRTLGKMIGRYLTVQDNPSFIAAMPLSDQEDDRLVTVTREGKMIIYGIQDI